MGARAIQTGQALEAMEPESAVFDFEEFFRAQYVRVARAVARVTGDPARAEELASEALWKLWLTPAAQGNSAAGWLHRTALRLGLNELRGRSRRGRYEQLAGASGSVETPEEVHAASEERAQVRAVLAALDSRDAELLLLRSSGLSYLEVAEALAIHPASVGTLIARAQKAFRKEYTRRYGDRSDG